jgi:PIN domain nuclease of toxin-antitoxin system
MKGLLLDTHVVLWWLDDNPRLPDAFRVRIAEPALPCFVSAATIWEIGIKRAIGRLEAPSELIKILSEEGFHGLAMELVHAEAASNLPLHHHDPFDRMLIAQGRVESLTIASVDRRFADYDVDLL